MPRKKTLRDKIACRLSAEELRRLEAMEKTLRRALTSAEVREHFGNVTKDGCYRRT